MYGFDEGSLKTKIPTSDGLEESDSRKWKIMKEIKHTNLINGILLDRFILTGQYSSRFHG